MHLGEENSWVDQLQQNITNFVSFVKSQLNVFIEPKKTKTNSNSSDDDEQERRN